jgi:hypothetical protein
MVKKWANGLTASRGTCMDAEGCRSLVGAWPQCMVGGQGL